MRSPRDDQIPLPNTPREQTVVLPASNETQDVAGVVPPPPESRRPFAVPRIDRSTRPNTQRTSIETVSVAGLAQATRELSAQIRRSRQVMRRVVMALHLVAGVLIGVALAALAVVWYLTKHGG